MAAIWSIVTQAFAFLFYLIAIGVPNWSTGSINDLTIGQTGDYNVGLWKVCATGLPASAAVFSNLDGDCRIGHCPKDATFSQEAWNANNLCDRAKSAQAFALLTIVCCLFSFYLLLMPIYRGTEVNFGWLQIWEFLEAFFAMVTWAIWAHWISDMNGDSSRTSSAVLQFGKQAPGVSFGFMILAMLISIWSFFIARRSLREERQAPAPGLQQSTSALYDISQLDASDEA